MVEVQVGDALSGGTASLRNEPVQARSTARLTALLDAAAEVIGEIGYERLTTAMVAQTAGASIGTVYRYFPDRIAVLQSLSARNLAVFMECGLDGANDPQVDDWSSAVEAAVDGIAAFFRGEPGFRSLRFGDVLDVRPRSQSVTGIRAVARQFAAILSDRFEFTGDDALQFRVEVALEIADALLARAFTFDAAGEQVFIAEARKSAADYLAGYYSR